MQAGELLLVDAAANYGYQASDITRTYPVSGTFTPAQRDIYELVLHAQEEAIKAARPGATLATIHNRTVEVLKEGLLKLGLIADTSGQQYAMWFTHSTSHFIGLDVHDVGSRTEPLQAGMTFTIEPGLYIRQSVLDQLPKTTANLALIARFRRRSPGTTTSASASRTHSSWRAPASAAFPPRCPVPSATSNPSCARVAHPQERDR